MKATMRSDGVIVISAENGVEAFALAKWAELSVIRIEDHMGAVNYHINPTWLLVNGNNPEITPK